MHLAPSPAAPEIMLYTTHSRSGLWRLDGNNEDAPPPYWAYHWAGGNVLARHLSTCPETVRGRHVLDLGSGSGLVGIAAAKAGAGKVMAADIDPYAIAALGLNALANDVTITAICADLTTGPAPDVDMILVGDLFYAPELANGVTAFLDRCITAGIEVLIGDPGRDFLPHPHLHRIAEYPVPDFGNPNANAHPSSVFQFSA